MKRTPISRFLPLMLALICVLPGIGLMIYKHQVLMLPLFPSQTTESWIIDVKIGFEAKRPVNATLRVPPTGIAESLESENFTSDGFAVAIFSEPDSRKVVWSGRPRKPQHVLHYRVHYQRGAFNPSTPQALPELMSFTFKKEAEQKALQKLLASLKASGKSTTEEKALFLLQALFRRDTKAAQILLPTNMTSTISRIKRAQRILAAAGIHGRRVQGLRLQRATSHASMLSWLQVFTGAEWKNFSLITHTWKQYQERIPWRYGYGEFVEIDGADNEDVIISILPRDDAHLLTRLPAVVESGYPLLTTVSSELQAIFRLILLIPLGALFTVFLRCVIGLTTFGTFMPVLIALSFRETTLIDGVIYFSGIILFGLFIRAILSKLRLLMVPRLSAILTCIIALIVAIAYMMEILGEINGATVALFPIIVITMTIERMSIIVDERGLKDAFIQAAWSMLAAVLCYVLIFNPRIEYIVLVYPEVLLIVLGANILLGRYTGYRLFELYRFRHLLFKKQDAS